jgi:riboflavin biosynthesis pyrimidine reductase
VTGSSSPILNLAPLEALLQTKHGKNLVLPITLSKLYGSLRLPTPGALPWVFSNFVSTLDGVVSLRTSGHAGGGDISGFDLHDRMVMGLLRAIADLVVVGSGTLAADPGHLWTADAICPELGAEYRSLRKRLRKPDRPINVIVSGSGRLDLSLPVFTSSLVRTVVLTTCAGARRLEKQSPRSVAIRAIHRGNSTIPVRAILAELTRESRALRILVEGGPILLGDCLAEGLIDELFLTLAPQIAGRKLNDGRLALTMGQLFAPSKPLWGRLTDLRRSDSHLFLRYSFVRRTASAAFRGG